MINQVTIFCWFIHDNVSLTVIDVTNSCIQAMTSLPICLDESTIPIIARVNSVKFNASDFMSGIFLNISIFSIISGVFSGDPQVGYNYF